MNITEHMLTLMHHTLGLRPDRRASFRNYFLASEGHWDIANLRALVAAGMMLEAKAPAFCIENSIMFSCTDAGKAYAIEHLPPEPKRTRYDEYLRADCCDSFADFLGINRPKYEMRGYGRSIEYRMARFDRSISWTAYPEVSGDWMHTKKEAKASYKEALKAFQTAAKACHG